MTLRESLAALGRRKRLLTVGLLLSLLVGLALAFVAGSEQRVSSRVLLVQPQPGATAEETLLTQQKLNLLAFTYAEIVASDRFLERAANMSGLRTGGVSVTGTAVKNTSIVQIDVRGDDAERGRAVAAAINEALAEELDGGELELPSNDELTVLVLEEPTSRDAANGLFLLVAAVVGGVALSATAAVLLETP